MADNFSEIAFNAKFASKKMAILSSELKNKALLNIAENIEKNKAQIFDANKEDLNNAKILIEKGELTQSAFNRLKLDENKMRDMIQGIKDIAALEDPIGKDKDDNTITLQDVLENNEKNIEEEVDLKLKMKKIYGKMKEILKSREKLIIEMRFGLNGTKPKTQNQIAKMMGISRSYVSRIETKAIGKLAKEIKE